MNAAPPSLRCVQPAGDLSCQRARSHFHLPQGVTAHINQKTETGAIGDLYLVYEITLSFNMWPVLVEGFFKPQNR